VCTAPLTSISPRAGADGLHRRLRPALAKDASISSATRSSSWWGESAALAMDAAELVEVDYDPLPL